jgi:hypothetical protein
MICRFVHRVAQEPRRQYTFWYYRLAGGKTFHTTGQTTRGKAEAYVVELLRSAEDHSRQRHLSFVSDKLTPPGRLAADERYCGAWNTQRTPILRGVRTSGGSGSTTSRPGGQVATRRSPTAEGMDYPGMPFSTGSGIWREVAAGGL